MAAAAADEPRRSGRATKGQHTKNNEEDDSPEAAPKSRGKGKNLKKGKAQDEQSEEPEGDGDDNGISCLCGIEDDDDEGRNFLCCDKCATWQHNDCMALPPKWNPPKYFCWRCQPSDHPEIIEALDSGEAPEELAARMRTRKVTKKGRPSLKGTAAKSEASVTPVPTPAPEQNKRKHTGDENGEQPTTKRGKSGTPATETGSVRGRGRRSKAAAAADHADEPKTPETIADIPLPQRQKIASSLRDKLVPLAKSLTSQGLFPAPTEQTLEALVESKVVAVEQAMFASHATGPTELTAAYQSQYRTIISNVPQNTTLFMGILDGSVGPDALSTMTSNDMATEEQKKLDDKMKKEGEKQAMLIQEQGPRIRRTHKGDELVEDSGGIASESITSTAPPRRMLSTQDDEDMTPIDTKPSRPAPIVTGYESSPDGHRRSSSNFNIQNVWSSVQSPSTDQRPAHPSRPDSSTVSQQQQQKPDADIDRLLDDDGVESAPYSPVDANHDPYLVWRGLVDMPVQSHSIFHFPASAYHVAGFDLGGKDQQAGLFPKDLTLAGRIAANTADQYLVSLSVAHNTDVSVFEIIAHGSDAATKDQFDKLFAYLKERQRFGVVSTQHASVKDCYLIPLNAGNEDTPQFLARLDHNLIEEPRSRRMLVLVFVQRYKDSGPVTGQTPAPPSILSPNGQTPGQGPIGSAPAMSPTTAVDERGPTPQFPQGQPQGQYSFPGNPYAPQQQAYSTPPAQAYAYPGAAAPPPGNSVQQQNRELAARVLGPMMNAPVAQSILATASTQLSAGHLESLRQIFDDHPTAQNDMQEVQRILGAQNNAGSR